MSIDSVLEVLRKKADDVSQRVYKKRCSLAHETDRDSFLQDAIEFSRIEGLLEGLNIAMSEIKKHIGVFANVSASAKRSAGEDINVPATDICVGSKLPAWVKEGTWVTDLCPKHSIGVIEHISGEWITVRMKKHPIGKTRVEGCFEAFSPIRFRAYTFEEAKGLIGKVMESSLDDFLETELITRVALPSPNEEVSINGSRFEWHAKECNATIDGVPIGIPEVDEEAMEGDAE